MTANDSSNKRHKPQTDSRGVRTYQTIRPKGWDFTEATPESPPEPPLPHRSAQAARPNRPHPTILPPPINSPPLVNPDIPAAAIPAPVNSGRVNHRQADTDPDPTNIASHDTQSPQIADNLSDTIAYHTTSAAATEESAPANTATPAPPDSTWIGASGGLQVRRCGIGGTITGVPQSVMHSRGNVNLESRVEYTIQGVVGRGGMGVVQKARQTTLNRIVAIKSLQTRLASPDTAQRMFVAEALITAGLVHPNIVPLHDMGVDHEGRLFYSMKLVSGKTWQDMIPAQSLEANLDVLLKVCDAVAYAHSRGVINRDLKPENVIVGDFGEVVVLDWGVAVSKPKFAAPNNAMQFPPDVAVPDVGPAGTPAYMAPELLDDETHRVSPASDVYLLGAMLYEILEGYPPHVPHDWRDTPDSNDKRAVVMQAAFDNYIEPGGQDAGELMQIANKAMQTHPEDRYHKVEDFQEAIRQYRITGRAEELLLEAKHLGQSRYDEYQQSVALFANAIKQWKDNQRARQGNVQAREAFAELALKRGDYDLGLEVVASADSPRLQQLERNLKRSRLQRKIIRTTWVLFGGAAAILLAVTLILGLNVRSLNDQANEAKAIISSAQRQVADSRKQVAVAELQVAAAEQEAKQEINAARATADQLIGEANKQKEEAKDLANKYSRDAEEAKRKAADEEIKKQKAMDAAEIAKKEAADSRKVVAEQQVLSTFARLESLYELREWHELQEQASKAIEDESLRENPFFNQARQDEISRLLKAAKQQTQRPNTNSRRELPSDVNSKTPTLIAMSDNGGVLARIVSNGPRAGKLQVIMAEYLESGQPQGNIQILPVQADDISESRCALTISRGARAICLLTPKTERVWIRNSEGQFHALALPNLNRLTPQGKVRGHVRFTSDDRYLFLVDGDKRSSIQILDLQSDPVRPLLPSGTTLFLDESANHTCTQFAILPDGSGLLHYSADPARKDERCRFFPVTWTDGVPALPKDADKTGYIEAATLAASGAPQLQQSRIGLLEVTPDGQLLIGLDGRDSHAITLAARKQDPLQLGQFPFDTSPTDRPLQWFRSREPRLPGIVRVGAGGKTIVVVRENQKRDNLEVWAVTDRNVSAAVIEGTERFSRTPAATQPSQPVHGTIVSGQSSRILALSVPADDESGRIFFAADDRAMSRWNLDTWHQLPQMAEEIVEQFRKAATPPQQAAKLGQAIFSALPFPRDTARSDSSTQQSTARYVYSAELSPDNSSVIIGTNELDARALKTADLSPVDGLNLRPDPLAANPSATEFQEGHKSNIAAIRFIPPNGELLLTSENLGVISIWDAVADADGIGREKSRLVTNLGTAAFAVSADGSLILAGGADLEKGPGGKEVPVYQGMLWNTADALNSVAPQPARILRINPENEGQLLRRGIKSSFQITATAISKDNRIGVTGGRRGELVFWSLEDGAVRAFERSHGGDQVSAMFFDATGRLVTAGYDGQIIRWTLNDGSTTPAKEILYRGRQVLQMEASPELAFIAICELSPANAPASASRPNAPRSSLLRFSVLDPNGKLVRKLNEFEVPATSPTLPFETGFAWSADGSRLLMVSNGKLTLRLAADWSVEKSFVVERTPGASQRGNVGGPDQQRPARAAFSPASGNLLATLNQREAHLWDIEKSTHLAEFRTHHSRRLTASWSADQRMVLTSSDAIRVFDADPASPNRGQTLLRIPVGSGNSPLAFARFSPTPGDLRFLSGNEAGEVTLYRCTNSGTLDGQPTPFPAPENAPLPDEAAELTSLRFPSSARWSPDGKMCALIRNGALSCWKIDEQIPRPLVIRVPDDSPLLRFSDVVIAQDGDSLLVAAAGLAWIANNDQLLPAAAFWKLDAQNELVRVGLLLDSTRHFGDQQAQDDVAQDLPPGITAIAFDPLSRTIFTGGRDGRIFEWSAGDLSPENPTLDFFGLAKEANIAAVKNSENLFTRVIALQVAIDGRLVAADSTGNILIWAPVPE